MTSDPSSHPAGRLLDDLLCFELYSVSRAMTALYRPLLQPLGLTYPQFLVLEVLSRRGPSSIGEIGEATRLDHGTLTPLLRRMADRSLVLLERSSDDGRSVTASLAERGLALRPTLEQVHCSIRDVVALPEADLTTLQGLLGQVGARLDAHLRPVTPG